MKILKLLLCCLLLPEMVWAACTGSSPTWTCSASSTSTQINSCIASAVDGDTINVGTGSGTWSTVVTIDKSISLIGAGSANTIITSTTGGHLLIYDPHSYATKHSARVSGFYFDCNNTGGFQVGDTTSAGYVKQEIRIDNNVFYDKNNAGDDFIIDIRADFNGVIDNKTFDAVAYPFSFNYNSGYGWDYYSTSPQSSWTLGSDDRVYMEDNTINLLSYPGSPTIVVLSHCQYSGRFTYRYNTFNIPSGISVGGQDFIDSHGNQGCANSDSMCSCFGAEIYGNKIDSTASSSYSPSKLFNPRGGKSLAFYNTFVGSGSGEFSVTTSGPVTCPALYAHETMIHDTYFWGNRNDTNGTLMGATCDVCPPYVESGASCDGYTNRPTEGAARHYVDFADDVDSSPAGVSCGTLANLPATCSIGDAYWATSQSCSDLTGMVGVAPSTTISGTLYQCQTTNNWTSIYTPYTYPHPLRGESSPTIEGVSVTGVTIQ